MGVHAFVDETKERGYLMAAVLVPDTHVDRCRQDIQSAILPGQRRIHFASERPARRGQILAIFKTLEVQAAIFDGRRYKDVKMARDACLTSMVDYLAQIGVNRLVLEREDAALRSDNLILFESVRKAGLFETLRYYHMRAREECLLSMPDGVAWAWARGGHWRDKVRPLVRDVWTL